ncbi:MAG: DUF1850 domain-containing protein [Chloroflexia bacterium]|nr:DUF1850 domain-containing protein [Chloroflexia bacterium]
MPPRRMVANGLALAAILALGGALTPAPVVTLKAGTGGPNICRSVAVGETFLLVFRHSMYGGEVREEFQAEDGRLVRTGVKTEKAAAAEYYAYDGRVEPAPDGYRVIVPPATMDEVVIRLDRIGQHRLRFNDEELALTEPSSESVAATLRVESVPLFARQLIPSAC